MAKGNRSLRYQTAEDMPSGMRTLLQKQEVAPPPARPLIQKFRNGRPVVDTPKKSKYSAVRTVVDGIPFDSKKEARYYEQLKQRKAAGEVLYFLMQVPFRLPGGVRYVIDFMEVHADGRIHWVDVKGVETPLFKMKKKQVEELYGVEIETV